MTDEEFYEAAIHTDAADTHLMQDYSAGQFLIKMATLNPGGEKTQVSVYIDTELRLWADTPLGRYEFIIDTDDQLVVDQVL